LALIRRYGNIDGKRILDVGCGLGAYVRQLSTFSEQVCGVDIDPDKVQQAGGNLGQICQAPAEGLPFQDQSFDVVLLHEVLEHVDSDRKAAAEAYRVTSVGGRVVVFVPNRWYPFETHGVYFRGRYHFGNVPLVNYLPSGLRSRLCPHVRTYTTGTLRKLFRDLPHEVVVHVQIFPGYDNVAYGSPRLAYCMRRVTYAFEHTPRTFPPTGGAEDLRNTPVCTPGRPMVFSEAGHSKETL
jgi:SAM-dependent methyltransferase